jgi:exodeoxyribonuclease V gamma subunit
VEVLRDRLLDLFEKDRTLEPHDVVVMTSDIDLYAPLIEAVCGTPPEERGYIPYRVADQKIRASNLVANALLRVLELSGDRMRASDVLDLLQLDPVRERFDIAAEQLAEVRRMVFEAGIRWGIDGRHRASVGQPSREENTWRHGLNRLLLGQVMSSEDAEYAGVLPVLVAGSDARDLVGKVSEMATSLFAWCEILARPKRPAEWRVELNRLLDAFVSARDPHVAATRTVRAAIDEIFRHAEQNGFDRDIDHRAVALLLRGRLGTERASRSFLSGGVTFCALLPMRSVPFRVVAVLGLDDTAFPRHAPRPAFDLVAHDPEPGDRSIRDEDRQLFLEAILSARDHLLLFYEGRAVQDNAELPPSVVVAELLDVLDSTFSPGRATTGQLALSLGEGVSRRVVVPHPLQAWSPRYFQANHDPRLFSFVDADAEGARALSTESVVRPSFHVAPLQEGILDTIDVEALARFFENPARGLVQRRLGIVLDDEPSAVSNREPIALDPLQIYEVGARLFAEALRRGRLDQPVLWARGLGLLPLGTPGTVDAERVLREVLALHELTREWTSGGRLPPLEVNVGLDRVTLTGVLRDRYAKGQVFSRFTRLKAKSEIGAWVRHLSLCAAAPADGAATTAVLGRSPSGRKSPEARIFEPVEPARARDSLARLVHLYRLGQRAPLSFFPSASRRFVEALREGSDEAAALSAAQRAFFDQKGAAADADDAYVHRLFESENPFDTSSVPFDGDRALALPSFAELSRTVFEPLLAATSQESA